jgi:predicted ATP-grasp superfamily ATP-dependent carboligase
MRALILDSGLDRGSLAAARALAAEGWTVGVGAPFRGLAGSSRAVAAHHTVPAPSDGVPKLLSAARAAIEAGSYDVVFSSDDEGVLALCEHRDELAARVPYGSTRSVRLSQDKLDLTRRAAEAGLPVPRTERASEAAITTFEGSVVIKPSFTFAARSPARLDARVIDDPAQAVERAREIERAGLTPLVQEVISGGLMAFSCVADRSSQVVARLQQRAERTWPPAVGVSARAVSVPVDEWLAERVGELLRRLEWFGLAQLQFLLGEDGVPRLVDFNGRFYGSLALAQAAGVNLVGTWARLAMERPTADVPEAVPGRRYQWLSRDLRACARDPAQGKVRGIAEALHHAPRATHSVWRLSDPWPAVSHYGGRVIRRVRDGVRSAPAPTTEGTHR